MIDTKELKELNRFASVERIKQNRELSPVFKYNIIDKIHGKKILDIGCGDGLYLQYFSNDSIGLDIIKNNSIKCKELDLFCILNDINIGIPFKNNSFDIIFCSHILEHVISPIHILLEINRVLKKNGKIIIVVPNEKSIVRLLIDHYFKDHPSHLYSFSTDCLEKLLKISGFSKSEFYIEIPLTHKKYLKLISQITNSNTIFQSMAFNFANSYCIIGRKIDKGEII